MINSFDRALNFVLKWEGGYVDHPQDPGGATNRGVTQSVYDSYRERNNKSRQSVRQLTDNEMHDIYKKEYWDKLQCDILPPKLAIALFDCGVNTGNKRAIKQLQGVLGIAVDGRVGDQTRQAWQTADGTAIDKFMQVRREYYVNLGKNYKFKVFLKGWLNRWVDLARYLQYMG